MQPEVRERENLKSGERREKREPSSALSPFPTPLTVFPAYMSLSDLLERASEQVLPVIQTPNHSKEFLVYKQTKRYCKVRDLICLFLAKFRI